MKTILFYSYRGGTGRTTVLANVAVALARWGAKVCMLDLDLSAPGLERWQSFRPKYEDFGDTFLDYFQKCCQGECSDRLPLYRIKEVKLDRPGTAEPYTAALNEGGLWFLPTGLLSRQDVRTLLSEIMWPQGIDQPGKPNTIQNALRKLVKQIEHELAPNYLLIDTSPGYGSVYTQILNVLNPPDRRQILNVLNPPDRRRLDLVVVTTRVSAQGRQGFDMILTLGEQLAKDKNLLFPIITFVPPGFQATQQFREKLIDLQQSINQPIRHWIPVIPELATEERILTVVTPEEVPASESYWDIARAITIRLRDAPGLYAQGKDYETNRQFPEAAEAYRQAYLLNPAYRVSMLGIARSYAEAGDLESAEGWLRNFLEAIERKAWQDRHLGNNVELRNQLSQLKGQLLKFRSGDKKQKGFDYYKNAAKLALGLDFKHPQDYSHLLSMKGVDPAEAQETIARLKRNERFSFRFQEYYNSEAQAGEPEKKNKENDEAVAKELGEACDDLIRTLEAIAKGIAKHDGAEKAKPDSSQSDLDLFHDQLKEMIGRRREQLQNSDAMKDRLNPGQLKESLTFYNAFGAYTEQQLEDILRWNEWVLVSGEKPESLAEIIEAGILFDDWKFQETDRQYWYPQYIPYRVGLKEYHDPLSKLSIDDLAGLLENLDNDSKAEPDPLLLSPFVNRMLYIIDGTRIPIDSLLKRQEMNAILSRRPGCRFLIIISSFEEAQEKQGVVADLWDTEAIFGLAPLRDREGWLNATVGYSSDSKAEPSAPARSIESTDSDSDDVSPLTIVIEDQGPGRALRDLLQELGKPTKEDDPSKTEPQAKLEAPTCEVWLAPYTAIQRMMRHIEWGSQQSPTLIEGGDKTKRNVDLLVVSQPRFKDLVDTWKVCRIERLSPLQRDYGYFLSINTGYLVYRRDYFKAPKFRQLYYEAWQTEKSEKKRLRPPRNLQALLEKAAFFNYVSRSEQQPSQYKELKSGLGLQHGLPKDPKEISDDDRLAFWSQWSMISRMLIGKDIKENPAPLDKWSRPLFKKALWRFLALHIYSSPDSWSQSWDEMRRQLVDGTIVMAVCWNDSTPLFDEFVRRENERREKEKREKIDIGYTLIGLDDNPYRMPTPHIDGHIAILLTPEKKDAAIQLFKWFEAEKIQEEFAHRGGSPISEEVVKMLEEQPDRFHRAYQMDLAATRYGISREYQANIRKKAIDQAQIIINCLRQVPEEPVDHNDNREFQHTYQGFIAEQRELGGRSKAKDVLINDLVARINKIFFPEKRRTES